MSVVCDLYLFDSLLHDLHQVLGVTHIAGLVLRFLEVGRSQGVALVGGRRKLEGVAWSVLKVRRGRQESPGFVAVETGLGPVRRAGGVSEALLLTEGEHVTVFQIS